MGISKKTSAMAEKIMASLDEGKVVGDELYITGAGALEQSLEDAGIPLDMYNKAVEHNSRFATALAHAGGNVAIERMSDNAEINSVVVATPLNETHGHTARIARCHEPVEGKPQYGHVQVHTSFSMDETTSNEFRGVVRTIGKNAKAAFESAGETAE